MKDLSIIIPMYNEEKYITKCLESVTKKIGTNVEIIIIDDCSIDKSLEKVYSFIKGKKKFKKIIKIIKNEERLGPGPSIQKGIKKSKGVYIGVQSADDFVDNKYYKKMLYQALKTNADIVISDIAKYFDENNIIKSSIYNDNIYVSTMDINSFESKPYEINNKILMGHWACASSSTKIIKRKLFSKFSYKGTHANDLMKILPIICEAKKIIYIPNLYKYYRLNTENQISQCKKIENYFDTINSIRDTLEYFYYKNDEFSRIFFYNNCLNFFFSSYEKLTNEDDKKSFVTYFKNELEKINKNIFEIYKHTIYHTYYFDNSNFNYQNYDNLSESVEKFINKYEPKCKEKQTFNPLVSIVIPVYNGSNYIKTSIDSALAQTYKNLEIIVVNDGSDDEGKTDEIAKSYGSKIRYFKKENGGVATALNVAIKNMKGEYFSWLSHDDYYYPTKIEDQIKFLSKEKEKNIVLYSDNHLMDENDKVYKSIIRNHRVLIEKDKYSLINRNINGITLLIPKKVFDENGLFETRYRTTQDYHYWNNILYKYKFYHIDKILAKYRIHPEQDTNSNPKTLPECNELWIKIFNEIPKKLKEEYENSELAFDEKFLSSFRETPYKEAIEYIEKQVTKKLDKIKISVIIPFYNRKDLVIRAIKSVESQTHKNWELILVNDGSTDDISIVEKYIKRSKNKNKIKYIKLGKNKGVSYARNIGIDNATGEYIAFLDSDDEFLAEKLRYQLEEILKSEAYISHTNYIRVKSDTEKEIKTTRYDGECMKQLIKGCSIALPTIMIKSELLKDNKFDITKTSGEDVSLWLQLSKKYNFKAINKPLTKVYVNNNSHSQSACKQLLGTNNIIKTILDDDILNKNIYEIGKLYRYYISVLDASRDYPYIIHKSKPIKRSILWKLKRPFVILKNRGIKLYLWRIIRSFKKNG